MPGSPPPVFQYFSVLLERGKLNGMESIELTRPVLTQGRTDMLEKWLTEVRQSVRRSVRRSVRQSVRPSVRQSFSLCLHVLYLLCAVPLCAYIHPLPTCTVPFIC